MSVVPPNQQPAAPDSEKARRSAAAKRGYALRLARGGERRRGPHPPLGTRWANPEGRETIPDEEQQQTLREIVRLRDEQGLSWRGIARTLLVAGIEWKQGSEWSETRCRRGYEAYRNRGHAPDQGEAKRGGESR
jgi:hypothetical protein